MLRGSARRHATSDGLLFVGQSGTLYVAVEKQASGDTRFRGAGPADRFRRAMVINVCDGMER